MPSPEKVEIVPPKKTFYEEIEEKMLAERREEIELEKAEKEKAEQIERYRKISLAARVILKNLCGMAEEMEVMRKDLELLIADSDALAKELKLTESDAERLKKLEEKLHLEMKNRRLE